ncbi:MAG: ATP-binding protein [Lachnospiraceae bacterium]|nr:ATP-binding protein [Lachnospiraceae bacterium]
MRRHFNVTGSCDPQHHYMVDIKKRLEDVKNLVDAGAYFTINRARQYGKTTLLRGLAEYLLEDYYVISIDFQMLSQASFRTEEDFVKAFSEELLIQEEGSAFMSDDIRKILQSFAEEQGSQADLRKLFIYLSRWCREAEKPMVLMIDEVDSASNNQVFLDFLAQLRGYYLHRNKRPSFQSVILAGVYDVKNIKQKIRKDEEHKLNSPWNIAADFKVDMSFSKNDIAGMLKDYEADHDTGMDIEEMAGYLFDYTSGYPFLVSRLCKLLDEELAGKEPFAALSSVWTKDGFLEAVKILLSEKNPLFESLMGKLQDYPSLDQKIHSMLFSGEKMVFSPFDRDTDMAIMFGFAKKEGGNVVISNRIFETLLYDYYLTVHEVQREPIFKAAAEDKNQFIMDGHLNMELVLEKYVQCFDDIYGSQNVEFDEEEGRRRFMLYMKPIINGTGNYYVEARTRNLRRMDLVIDYRGEQFVVELKIWRGNAYNERGEQQLSDYLDYFHLKKGYMLSYNFNQSKKIGVQKVMVGDRCLIEAVV